MQHLNIIKGPEEKLPFTIENVAENKSTFSVSLNCVSYQSYTYLNKNFLLL